MINPLLKLRQCCEAMSSVRIICTGAAAHNGRIARKNQSEHPIPRHLQLLFQPTSLYKCTAFQKSHAK